MGLLLAIAILSSFYLTPVAMRVAWRYDAVSRPDGFRKKHSRPTPAWGGLAVNASIFCGMAVSLLLMPAQRSEMPFLAALGLSIVALGILGCYDDLFEIRARVKLAGQLLAIVPLIAVGAYVERITVLGFAIELGWLGIPWTAAWLVLGINAWNLIDGMDGLASMLGITVAAVIAVVAGIGGNTHVVAIAVVLAGALGGFLAHNLPPARIYLGDCGSMVLGLLLSTLAIRVAPQEGGPNLVMMCALLFVPLYDTVLAIVRRGLNGKGIMTADRGHIHHRLLDRGLGVWSSLALLTALSLTTGAASCCAMLTGQELIAYAALAVVPLLCTQLRLFGDPEWAMVKDRLSLPRIRGRASWYPFRLRKSSGLELAKEASKTRNPLEGLPQTQTSLTKGINVRLAGTQSVRAATTGKEYVELLG